MNLITGSWATDLDKVVALSIVERRSSALKEVAASYEGACKPFVTGTFDGKWSWFDSQLFQCRFLVTDIFEDLRNRQGFDAMAVPRRQFDQKSHPEIYTPPLIQVSKGASTPTDAFEHEATHVAQLLVDYDFAGKPRVPFPGPIPFLTERILNEFEAYLVQSVHFERAYKCRLVFDFNCIESSQFSALRAGFQNLFQRWAGDPGIASDLLKFGAALADTFKGTVLEVAEAIPTLDQLAFHLYVQIRKHGDLLPADDPRRQHLLNTFVPVFMKWSGYESTDSFEILLRFRPPNPPPNLNEDVMG